MLEGSRVVATDTSVLINLIHVGRLDILESLAPWTFVVPERVEQEITRHDQARLLVEAVERGFIQRVTITEPPELGRYVELLGARIGKGEASCLAMALERGWTVASDERGRFLHLAQQQLGDGRLVNTPGLLLLAIRRGVLSIDDADRIKMVLEARRFRRPSGLFAILLRAVEWQRRMVRIETFWEAMVRWMKRWSRPGGRTDGLLSGAAAQRRPDCLRG